MRVMMMVIPKGYEKAEPGFMPDAKLVEKMMAYNKSLAEAGVLLALDGLHPPSVGARVTLLIVTMTLLSEVVLKPSLETRMV